MADINKASAPKSENNGVYHLQLKIGDVPKSVIIPGAPERTVLIARHWENAREVAQYREFKTVRGFYKGVDIAATSTGIGGASSEICINELHKVGVDTCIRVGTTGCIQPDIEPGELIIPYAAVRKDGTSDSYIDPSYPAVANIRVTMALMQACEQLGYKYRLGIGYTVGSFYIGQARHINEDGSGYYPSKIEKLIPDLQSAGITNIEMETAAQYVVGMLHGMRMGAIMSVISNRITDKWGDNGGEEKSCIAACEAIKILENQRKNGIF